MEPTHTQQKMEHQPSDSPSLAGQVLRALPSTIVSSASMAFTGWFASTHYFPDLKFTKDKARGPKGEKLMPSEAKFLEDMRRVVHYYKALEPKKGKEYQFSVGHFLKEVESLMNDYGLVEEQEHARQVRSILKEKFTKGAEPTRDKAVSVVYQGTTETGATKAISPKAIADKSPRLQNFVQITETKRPSEIRAVARRELFKKESKVFDILENILKSASSLNEAKAAVGSHADDFFEFRNQHNNRVISSYRTPLTIGITGAVALGTMISGVSKQREKVALSERIDQLEQHVAEEAGMGR